MVLNGLTSREVSERRASGLVNTVESKVSRSYKSIIVENVFNWFNMILVILGIALYLVDDVISAISATGIIALNVLVSTVQEIRAKRRLDKIALLLRPKVNVIRDGKEIEIDQSDIVMDDVVHLVSGDQALVDGVLLEMRSLEMDESALTGESSAVRKKVGDAIYSGSFCITGEAYFRVTALGSDTFASKMLFSARSYKRKLTPLQIETTSVTKLLISIAAIIFVIEIIFSVITGKYTTLREALRTATIILDIVPIALFLLITLTYMIAALRMADSGVLLQRSSSVESMSHVDTVCMDKTGTITTNRLIFENFKTYMDYARAEKLVRIFVEATGSKNRTVQVLADEFGTEKSDLIEEIQFSSERKFSAVRVEQDGEEYVIYMGAWPSLENYVSDHEDVSDVLSDLSKRGLRSVVLCEGSGSLFENDVPVVRDNLTLIGVASISDEVRPDCRKTMDFFMECGIEIKVVSGDDPETIDALFSIADIPGERKIITGDQFAALSDEERKEAVLETNIFGRMKPEQKEIVIDSLKTSGRYVAMVGDGVNDVKAIKAANVGVSLESGSGATRGAADMVLMGDNFGALPKALKEGRRTVSGMRDILKVYLTRNFALMFIILAVLFIFNNSTPLLPVQNTMYAFLTVSVYAFLMTLWAQPDDNKEPILPNVIRFAVPTAFLIAFFGMIVYAVFYFGTGHFINIDYRAMADSCGISYETLIQSLHSSGTNVTPETFEAELNRVNARNAMLFFIILAGILELLMVQPIFKRFSIDGKTTRDLRPTGLILLLLLAFAAVFFLPEARIYVITLLMTATFPIVYYIPIIALTVIWFAVTRRALRSGKFSRLAVLAEKRFDEKLKREHEKAMREDLCSQGE